MSRNGLLVLAISILAAGIKSSIYFEVDEISHFKWVVLPVLFVTLSGMWPTSKVCVIGFMASAYAVCAINIQIVSRQMQYIETPNTGVYWFCVNSIFEIFTICIAWKFCFNFHLFMFTRRRAAVIWQGILGVLYVAIFGLWIQ